MHIIPVKNDHAKDRLVICGGAGGRQTVLGLCENERERENLMPISENFKVTLRDRIPELVSGGAINNSYEWTACKGIDFADSIFDLTNSHSASEFAESSWRRSVLPSFERNAFKTNQKSRRGRM